MSMASVRLSGFGLHGLLDLSPIHVHWRTCVNGANLCEHLLLLLLIMPNRCCYCVPGVVAAADAAWVGVDAVAWCCYCCCCCKG